MTRCTGWMRMCCSTGRSAATSSPTSPFAALRTSTPPTRARPSTTSRKSTRAFGGADIEPPDNPRSWDNCLITVETGGLRILHWGDNRHNPPPEVWEALGRIDIALLPVDGSQHVMGFAMVEHIIETLRPRVVIPHHYYIWDVVQRQSTLQPADAWVDAREAGGEARRPEPALTAAAEIRGLDRAVHFFGDHVAFDREAWHREGG